MSLKFNKKSTKPYSKMRKAFFKKGFEEMVETKMS